MYFWNTNALAKELRDDTLPEREKFKYFLAYVVLTAFAMELFRYLVPEYSLSAVLASAFNILAVIVGVYICYKTNQNGDGLRFIERYICLSLPVSIRIVVLSLAVYLLLIIVLTVILKLDDPNTDTGTVVYWFGTLFGIVITVLFYWRLNVHIKSISHNETGVVPA